MSFFKKTFLVCSAFVGIIQLKGLGHTHTPFFVILKVSVFRYLLAPQDPTNYSVLHTSTLRKVSELSELRVLQTPVDTGGVGGYSVDFGFFFS